MTKISRRLIDLPGYVSGNQFFFVEQYCGISYLGNVCVQHIFRLLAFLFATRCVMLFISVALAPFACMRWHHNSVSSVDGKEKL